MASKAFGGFVAAKPHLVHGPGGLANEIELLRSQVEQAFTTIEGDIAGETFAAVFAPRIEVQATVSNGILLSTASIVAPTTYTGAGNGFTGKLAPGQVGNAKITCPKRLLITIGGTGGDWLGGTVHVIGKDADGNAQTEDITSAAGTGTATGVKYFSEVSSIALPAAGGTGATVVIGVSAEVACIMNGGSTTGIQVLTGNTAFNRNRIGNRLMSIARAVSIVFSSHADWDTTTGTLSGLDINGNAISESIAIPNGGGTVNGAKFFAQVLSFTIPAQSGTGGTFTMGIRDAILGLPKLKIDGAIAAVSIKELTQVDSTTAWTAPTAGAVTDAATALPNGSYTPNTAPDGASGRILVYIPAAA